MNTTRTFYGDQNLPLTNTRDDFKSIILSEIEKSEKHFSLGELISRIRIKCDFKKEPNLTCTGIIDFQGSDLDFINETIWEQIWDKKLMIDFTDKRQDRNPNIFHFTKMNGLTKK